jgi:hypothetical protein
MAQTTMAGKPFMWTITDVQKKDHVLSVVRKAFKVPDTTAHIPVENPVSLDRKNLTLLRDSEYIVAFKADGIRYLLVLTMFKNRPLAAFVNRAGSMYSTHVMAHAAHFQNNSVFDGELCVCINQPGMHDYLVFNALLDQGVFLGDQPYFVRLNHVRSNFSNEPVCAKERAKATGFISPCAPTLNFVRKEYDFAYNMRAMHLNVTPRYKYDGFIFTPCQMGVVPGRNDALFKWKSDNPIDIGMVYRDNMVSLTVDNNGTEIPLQDVVPKYRVVFDMESKALQQLIKGHAVYHALFKKGKVVFNHVIEVDCFFDTARVMKLKFLRLRPDKDGPNNVATILRTLQTINDNIQQHEIYNVVSK